MVEMLNLVLTSVEDGGWRKPGTVTVIFFASSKDGRLEGVLLCLCDIGPGSLLRERLIGEDGSSTRMGFIGAMFLLLADPAERRAAEGGLLEDPLA